MLAFTIIDVKDFMNKLLLSELFDHFCLVEATITTYSTFSVDGHLQYDFFDTDTASMLREKSFTYSFWKDIKPFCYAVIRGKRSPLGFKIILQLPSQQTQKLLRNSGILSLDANTWNFYLNLQYKNNVLLCTTGVSSSSFIPDKRPQRIWEETLSRFFSENQILFQKQ